MRHRARLRQRFAKPVKGETGLINATWIGATFEGIANGGVNPVGTVFELTGNQLRLEGIGVKNFKNGKAFLLSGDDILLRDLHVDNKTNGGDSGGIQLKGGKNFRCENTTIEVSGDALLLAPGTTADSISNATCLGLSGSTASGSVLAIETSGGAIDTVRIDGLKASGGSAGNVVRIKNSGTAVLTNVVVRNAVVTCGASTADGVSILNTSTGALNSLVLESFKVMVPGGTTANVAVHISATGTVPVDGVRWAGGGVGPSTGGTATLPSKYVVMDMANNIQLFGLRLDGSVAIQPVLIGGVGPCRSVTLGDVALTRVLGQTGATTNTVAVMFDQAVTCGMVRGSIACTSGTSAYAVRFTSQADGCYVEDANLTGISNANGQLIDVKTVHPYRLTDNSGSGQRSQLTLGPQQMVNLTSNFIAPISSSVILTPSPNTVLNIIRTASTSPAGQSLPGDLLVLSVASGFTVTVNDSAPGVGTGNIRLQSAANIQLDGTGQDTLTLLCRGPDWVQVAYAKNT